MSSSFSLALHYDKIDGILRYCRNNIDIFIDNKCFIDAFLNTLS
jgi:hypothetical protein